MKPSGFVTSAPAKTWTPTRPRPLPRRKPPPALHPPPGAPMARRPQQNPPPHRLLPLASTRPDLGTARRHPHWRLVSPWPTAALPTPGFLSPSKRTPSPGAAKLPESKKAKNHRILSNFIKTSRSRSAVGTTNCASDELAARVQVDPIRPQPRLFMKWPSFLRGGTQRKVDTLGFRLTR
jgi:hypothetical protein